MNGPATKNDTEFALPPTVVSKTDVARLVSEFERVDNDLTTAEVRDKVGAGEPNKPAISDALEVFLAQNNLSLGNSLERSELVKRLRRMKDTVPVIHMTFAVPADRESLQELAAWLRQSVHPQAVISVGVQPSLVAGVYLRTPNHVHDLSLRTLLDGRHDVLVKELEALRGSN